MTTTAQHASRWWRQRTPRERLLVQVCGLFLLLVGTVWLAHWIVHTRQRLAYALPQAQARMEQTRADADEYLRLHAQPVPARAGAAGVAQVIQAAGAGQGLGIELQGQADATGIRVRGQGVPTAVLAWLADVQKTQGWRVSTLRVDAGGFDASLVPPQEAGDAD